MLSLLYCITIAIIDSVFCIVIKIINTPRTSTPKRYVYAVVSGMHKGDQNRQETMQIAIVILYYF